MMEEVISITTAYNTEAKRNHPKTRKTGVDGYTLVNSGTRSVDGGSKNSAVCPSKQPCTPPSVLCYISIVNMQKTTTPNIRETK